MSLKHIITQIELMPQHSIDRSLNSILFPIRKGMLFEAVKKEPNFGTISTLRHLDYLLTQMNPQIVHTLESTAQFVFNAQMPPATSKRYDKDAAIRAKEDAAARAKAIVLRKVIDKRIPAPRSAAILNELIKKELMNAEEELAENFCKAADAVALIESVSSINVSSTQNGMEEQESLITDQPYDEAEIPEWVTDAVIDKIVGAATDTYRDAKRRLDRARYAFQETEPRAAMDGALLLLKVFGVTEEEVLGNLDKARISAEALFKKLLTEDVPPTIDTPPEDNTPAEKKGRYTVKQDQAKGLSSADMGAAANVK